MGRVIQHSLLIMGFGVASPWLVGMVACNDSTGGLALAGSGGRAGRAGTSAGSGQMELGGEGGHADPGTAGSKSTATGGTKGSTSSGGSHSHAGSGGTGAGAQDNAGGGNDNHAGTTSDPGSSGGAPDEPQAGAGGENEAGNQGVGAESGTGGSMAGSGGDSGAGGTSAGTSSGGSSAGGETGSAGSGSGPLASCIFHNDPAPEGGEGGAPPAPRGLAVATSAFIGPYLTDLNGLTLYIYGADQPGDCNYPPISNCTADCTQSWPIFDAGERTLPSTLDDSVFGTLDRGDGTFQTTYYGWPLYFYKTDTATAMINGQGKGKTWFAAEVILPNLMIMRGPTASGGVKYLGDSRGHTLYSLSGDVVGSGGEPPLTTCTGTCADAFLPFAPSDVFPVTSLEPSDVTLFLRDDGKLQAAYKGAPLYFGASDARSGDQLGVGTFGGAVVLP
jgi:predicted lipoprotein with Yx(FWY)xxD motif